MQRLIATKYFVGNFFVAQGYANKVLNVAGLKSDSRPWFLGLAGATGQLVHLAGFDLLKATAKWDVKCRSSFQLCAWERCGPLTRGALHPARFSKVKLLRSESTAVHCTNRTRASGDTKATIAAIRMQKFVAQWTYKAALDDAPGPFDDRHCHRLACA